MTSHLELLSHYQKYFYTVKAKTPELKNIAYHLRYQVYYEERKMISEDHVHEQLETDEWDPFSVHGLQFHKPSQQAIGNVRLIPLSPDGATNLPIEHHYSLPFDFSNAPIRHLHEGRTGEISRMAILSSFRRRASDLEMSYETDHNAQLKDGDKRFPINYMPMCLAFTAIILMMEQKLDYAVALMEPKLAKLLIRFGIDLMQIGVPMDYFGLRAPYLIFSETTYQNLAPDNRALFDLIHHELNSS